METGYELVIKPRPGWQAINLKEIWNYRDLFWYLICRDVQIRYRQTLLGVAWVVLQPLMLMLIFCVFFNRLGQIQSDGAPYSLFTFTGLLGWTFFANAVAASSNCLIGNQNLVSKIYFPRILIPLGTVTALLLDLLLNVLLCFPLLFFYGWPLTPGILSLPFFIMGTFLAANGLGFILSALNVQFRDVKYVVPFMVQAGMFLTPVIYPVSYVPQEYQIWLGLNPMAGMVEGFRYAFLGTPANWSLIAMSTLVSVFLFIAGLFIFRRMERQFADVI